MPTQCKTLTLVSVALVGSLASADVVRIGEIHPAASENVSGLTFDGGPNPLVLDGWGEVIWRLDISNGAIVETYPISGSPISTRALDFDSSSGTYYSSRATYTGRTTSFSFANPTAGWEHSLVTVDPFAGDLTTIGLLGDWFNFLDFAIHPTTGQLWLVTDEDGGSLRTVDTVTGASTLVHSFHNEVVQEHSMSIGPDGSFYVNSHESIFLIDPLSGDTLDTIDLGIFGFNYLADFEFDPITQRWYGIEVDQDADPRRFYLVEITGLPIPEPASGVLLLMALAAMNFRRRRVP